MKRRYQLITTTLMTTIWVLALGQERSLIASKRPKQDCTQPEVDQTLSSDSYSEYARCVIGDNYFAFYALYSRHLRDFPRETQDVKVKLTIGIDGNVEKVEARSDGVSDLGYLRRIEARLRLITFRPPEGDAREITHAFLFSKTN